MTSCVEIFKTKDSQDNLTHWLISTGDEQRDAALDFLALTCRAYDSYLEDWARHHAPRNGAGRLLARHALPLRESVTDFLKWDPDHNDAHALFDAITRADEAGAVSSLRRLAASYETEALGYERVGVDGAGPGTAAFERWAGVVGGSMGGMHALEWAVMHPERVERLAVIAAPPANTADQVALNSVQLEAIRMDPRFAGGDYYDAGDGNGPTRGLSLARRMALLNYRSPTELNQRFQRSWQSGVSPLGHGGRFAVESYLDFHGNKFTRRFDANTYLLMTRALDYFDLAREYQDSPVEAFKRAQCQFLVVSFNSDWRFAPERSREIVDALMGANKAVSYAEIDSSFGHDAFLLPNKRYQTVFNNYMNNVFLESIASDLKVNT